MKDSLFNAPGTGKQPFEFNAQVADVFDDMVSRSVPFYAEILQMSAEVAGEFYQQQTKLYDLGCSTGTLKKYLHATVDYIGIDSSPDMVQKAGGAPQFVCGDIAAYEYQPASVFVANFTLQFLRPLARQGLLRKIYSSLTTDGCLILSEKCLEDSADLSRVFANRHHALKERNGYSKLEIAEKRDALENVLIPFRVSENIEMLRDAGFNPISIFFKCYNFVSFLAIKS